MELGFVIVLVFIVLSFAGLMAKLGMDFDREKRRDKLRAQDNSLGVSELHTMIQDAVREATADLEARIEVLEQGEETGDSGPAKLPLGRPAGELEVGQNDPEEAAVPARRSRA
ncbi:MAG: hypothetical protein ACR2GR_07980 [Rhodothermales bacterium]